MSPASYLTAPPRGVAWIIAAVRVSVAPPGYSRRVLFWLSLLVSVAVVLAGAVFVALRALGLWRQVKATTGAVTAELERLAASAEAVGTRVEGLAGVTERLDASVSRLAVSRAKLNVLLRAWSEATEPYSRTRSYVPPEKKA
jgi:hypothetical protein